MVPPKNCVSKSKGRWCAPIVTFPRAQLPRDKPRFALSSHQREKSTKDFQFFISGDSSWRSAQADIRIMYIKSIIKAYSWHISRQKLTERVWTPGLSVPDERVCSRQPNLPKDVGNLSRGEYKTNLSCLINDQLASAQLSLGHRA